jgi:hypothetical protein
MHVQSAPSLTRICTLRQDDGDAQIEPDHHFGQKSNVGGRGRRTQQAPERRTTDIEAVRKGCLTHSPALHHASQVRFDLTFQSRMFFGFELT